MDSWSLREWRYGGFYCDEHLQYFATERGFKQHRALTRHAYFRYKSHVNIEDVTCECGYIPDPTVDNPKKCYADHRRRVHRSAYLMEKKPLVIEELP